MRATIKLVLVATVVGLLAGGFLPALFARGQLDNLARAAAQKASSTIMTAGASAQQLAAQSVSGHSGVHIVKVQVAGNTVYVTLSEDVQTIFHTFHLQSTQASSFGQ